MQLDYATLETLRQSHPAWRLLQADLAPLIASFLHKTYVLPNVRVYPLSELAEKLEDELFRLRQTHGEELFRREATAYLDEWAGDERGWLRKYYPVGEDEPHFDLTPASEKAIAWLAGLVQRPFVGTESRLLTVFNLLRQIVEGSETDVEVRLAELQRKAEEIQAEIERLEDGRLELLDDTSVRDRFLQMAVTARELLSDFREVEENFRRLDRHSRERIALWDGTKGELLDDIFGERDAIIDSDQGRSFRAFWDFLLSASKQEEFSELLDRALELPAVASMKPDGRIRRVHYDWLAAGEHTQRTVSALSQQLRRFIDDQAWLENRRIMEILKHVERQAVAVREAPPEGDFMDIEETSPELALPMERPLFTPPLKVEIPSERLELAQADLDTERLFSQVFVDKTRLLGQVRRALGGRSQVTLGELLQQYPLQQGLAELVTYLSLQEQDFEIVFDESKSDEVVWEDEERRRKARLPRVIYTR